MSSSPTPSPRSSRRRSQRATSARTRSPTRTTPGGASVPGRRAARCGPSWTASRTGPSRRASTITATRRPSSTGSRTARICRTGRPTGGTSPPTARWPSSPIHHRPTRPATSSGRSILPPPAADHGHAARRHAVVPGRSARPIASSPMGKLPLRARLATTIGGAAGRMSRLAGRGDGSVIGGVIGLRVEPDLLALLAAGRRVVLVTGTNGKTTTTRLITAALGVLGQEVASNAFGANMEAGLTAALGQAPDAPLAVLEVDEKYLPTVLAATRARAVALLNLSRDQMDRAAEIWLVARRWREALASAPNCTVIANADDPLIAWAAAAAPDVIWVAAGQCWHEDSWCCPQCGSHLSRDELGWRCGECEFTRPPARWVLDGSAVIDSAGRVHEVSLSLPGQANRSNAVIALAVGEVFGVEPAQALSRLRDVASVAGRYTQVERRGRQVRLLLAKNPAGWLEAFDVLDEPPVPVLLSVNAREPDGRDTSWLWDVDYRVLRGRPVFVTGERRLDLAVRLEADLGPVELVEGVDEAVGRVSGGRLDVIGNYTAFQQIRVFLGRAA